MQYAVGSSMNPGGARRQQGGELVSSMFGGSNPSQPVRPKKKSTAQPRPEILVQPRGLGPIMNPNENDVLSGRGGRINAHTGNVQYRHMVLARRDIYLDEKTKKLEKAHIAAQIVYVIRSMNPPGRFLKEDSDGSWWDIGDQKAIKKVGQAMREDGPTTRGDAKGDVAIIATSPAVVSSGAAAPRRTGSSSKKISPSHQPQVIPGHMMPASSAADGGFNLQNNNAISAAAAVAVNEEDIFAVPLFGRSYFPPGPSAPNDTSMLSGASAPSAMSGVSEISGLTDPISALSGSQFFEGKQEQIRETGRPPNGALDRMQRLGERVAIDEGIILPHGRELSSSTIPEDQASVDMMSLISLGNLSGVLREADRTVASSKNHADDLSTISGRMSGLSLDCSTLYDI